MNFLAYTKELMANDNKEANIKHFIIFMTAIHYFLASFMILFGIVRHTVDKDMMQQIMENDFYIICVGIGVLTVENLGAALSARSNLLSNILSKKKTTKDEDGTILVTEEKQVVESSVKSNGDKGVINAGTVNTQNIENVNTGNVNSSSAKEPSDNDEPPKI